MHCALTGYAVLDPVVSPKSGAVFERKHIEHYVASHNTDPINDEPLSVSELITVAGHAPIVPPIQARPQSIPALLSDFQNEWDAVALEMFLLRKQLFHARQGLAAAETHKDAAVRVVAKLIKERDEARAALQDLASSIPLQPHPSRPSKRIRLDSESNGESIAAGLSFDLGIIPCETISAARETLFEQHKSTKIKGLSLEHKLELTLTESHDLGHRVLSIPSYDIHSNTITICVETDTYHITCDSLQVTKADPIGDAICAISTGNSKMCVAYPTKFVIDNVTHSWPSDAPIDQIVPHPYLPNIFAVSVVDSRFFLFDVDQADKPCVFMSQKFDKLCQIAFHVDGALLAVGSDKQVQIFSVLDGSHVVLIPIQLPRVTSIVFAQNGYWMIVLSSDDDSSCIQVIDLRKNAVTHSISLDTTGGIGTIDDSSTMIIIQTINDLLVERYLKKTKLWTRSEERILTNGDRPVLVHAQSVRDGDQGAISGVKIVSCGCNGHIGLYLIS